MNYQLFSSICVTVLMFCVSIIASGFVFRNSRRVARRMQSGDREKESIDKQQKKTSAKAAIGKAGRFTTRKQLEKLENQLYDVGIKIPVTKFLTLWAACTLLLPIVLIAAGLGKATGLMVAICCAVAPIFFIRSKRGKRRALLEEQLAEAISVLCNALRAGHSFQLAMNNIAKEMSGPVAEEFGRVFRETQNGMTMAESMERMNDRVGSADLEMLCTAILIQRDVGGNLAEILENISETIQSRLALKAEIKTRTASGRLSGYIIGALPMLLLLAMYIINPAYCSRLFTEQMGKIMLMVGAVMEVIGFIVIQKVVSVKY